MTFTLSTVNKGDSPSPSSNSEVFTTTTTVIAATAYGKRWKKTKAFVVCGALLLVAVIVALVISRNSDDGKMMVLGGQGTSTANGVIGGTEVREDRYPYMVSLQTILDGHLCGGSLIARDVVLTAAHCQGCVDHVTVGRHNVSNYADGENITIREELPHPSYDDWTDIPDNDFMLVFLDRAADNVVPIKLNSDVSFPTIGHYATSMGWGDIDILDDNYTGSNVLKQVALKIVSNEDCENSEPLIVDGTTYNYMDQITKNMMCAKGGDREDTCQGDSGGPLIVGSSDEAVQVGVVSGGWFCATDQLPGVYARVSEAYEWIQREVCGGSDYASEAGFDCDGITTNGELSSPLTNPLVISIVCFVEDHPNHSL
jgi:secreted trypsin-like serine protease